MWGRGPLGFESFQNLKDKIIIFTKNHVLETRSVFIGMAKWGSGNKSSGWKYNTKDFINNK